MRNKIISYVLNLVSFIIENKVSPQKVIIYGSVASGEFDEKSDIDVFIDIDEAKEEEARRIISLFQKNFREKWELKGVENELSVIVGKLNDKKWDELRREIQSNGILVYSVNTGSPENMKPYLIFRLDFSRLRRPEKISLWRKLYGYKQKIGGKEYKKEGLLKEINGQKIQKSVLMIPSSKSKEFKDFLGKNKINYTANEVWID